MTEMSHTAFREAIPIIAKRGTLRFGLAGEHYSAPVEEIHISSSGKCVMVVPEIHIRDKATGEWGPISENGPTDVIFDWITATFEWLSKPDLENGKFQILTPNDGPIYVILMGEETAA